MAAATAVLLSCTEGPPAQEGRIQVNVKAVPAEWREYGDAPDGKPTLYREGAATGQFPTMAASGGPVHDLSGQVWLGFVVSPEGQPRYRDTDDGVLHLQVTRCAQSSALILVNTSGLTQTERATPVLLNLFFDWNRDGRWQGSDGCAQEWAVQNFAVEVSRHDEGNPWVLVDVSFTAGAQVQEFWYRAMVTRQRVGPQIGSLPDGETEDYLHQPALTFSARPGRVGTLATPLPDEPTFTCQGTVTAHGTSEVFFVLTQTVESQGRVVSLGRGNPQVDTFGPLAGNGRPLFLSPPAQSSAETRRLSRDRLEVVIRATVSHPEDGPERVLGPFLLRVTIAGDFRGAQQGTFRQEVDCGYYVGHSPDFGLVYDFAGAPVTTPDATLDAPPPGLLVIPHGRRADLRASDPEGRYRDDTLTFYQGEGANHADRVQRAALAASGLTATVPQRGRGLRIETTRDQRERLEWFMATVEGEDRNGSPIRDAYRFFVLHGPRELLERVTPLMTEGVPPEPEPQRTATATPTSTATATPPPTRTATPTATSTSAPAPVPSPACAFRMSLALQDIAVQPGEFHEGRILVRAVDQAGNPLPGVIVEVESRRSDGQVTRGTVTTNERGEALARARTTAFGQNTLIARDAQRAGCSWEQRANPPSLTWEARP